jgi:BlaI family transcriptional regulator, penicillinase repressor
MMDESPQAQLSRRERQIMDVVYQEGEATAKAIRDGMANPPSHSAVRATIRILEDKGYLAHRKDGRTHIYRPTVPSEEAGRSALQRLTQTFFGGSASQTVATLLSLPSSDLSEDELDALSQLIDRARSDEDASQASDASAHSADPDAPNS